MEGYWIFEQVEMNRYERDKKIGNGWCGVLVFLYATIKDKMKYSQVSDNIDIFFIIISSSSQSEFVRNAQP